MIALNNYLLIAGNGRNVGKTWLSEYCITQLAQYNDVVSLKIASHKHTLNNDIMQLAGKSDDWMIGEETNKHSSKDSGRMLKAGASIAYYAQLNSDVYLPELIQWLQNNIHDEQIVVCESAAIGKYLQPGKAFYVQDSSKQDKTCTWPFAYITLKSKQSKIINPPSTIRWKKNNWLIK